MAKGGQATALGKGALLGDPLAASRGWASNYTGSNVPGYGNGPQLAPLSPQAQQFLMQQTGMPVAAPTTQAPQQVGQGPQAFGGNYNDVMAGNGRVSIGNTLQRIQAAQVAPNQFTLDHPYLAAVLSGNAANFPFIATQAQYAAQDQSNKNMAALLSAFKDLQPAQVQADASQIGGQLYNNRGYNSPIPPGGFISDATLKQLLDSLGAQGAVQQGQAAGVNGLQQGLGIGQQYMGLPGQSGGGTAVGAPMAGTPTLSAGTAYQGPQQPLQDFQYINPEIAKTQVTEYGSGLRQGISSTPALAKAPGEVAYRKTLTDLLPALTRSQINRNNYRPTPQPTRWGLLQDAYNKGHITADEMTEAILQNPFAFFGGGGTETAPAGGLPPARQ